MYLFCIPLDDLNDANVSKLLPKPCFETFIFDAEFVTGKYIEIVNDFNSYSWCSFGGIVSIQNYSNPINLLWDLICSEQLAQLLNNKGYQSLYNIQ